MMSDADVGRLRIGRLSARLGVSPELLRAWEQRYGLLRPERSPGGFRLYSPADEARVRRVLALKQTGLSTAEAIRLALAEGGLDKRSGTQDPERPGIPAQGAARDARTRLASALEAFDEAGTQAAVDGAFATLGVDRAVTAVVLPALRDIGKRWEEATTPCRISPTSMPSSAATTTLP